MKSNTMKYKGTFVLNPRGNLWSKDGNKFGQRMLEKMGWSPGDGLGSQRQGIKEHIKTVANRQQRGFGFKESPYDIVDDSGYELVLSSLSKQYPQVERNVNNKDTKRKHRYTKIMKAKNVKLYSNKDLKSIFRTADKCDVDNSLDSISDQQEAQNDSRNHHQEAENCFTSTSTIDDYFSRKAALKKLRNDCDVTVTQCAVREESNISTKSRNPRNKKNSLL